MSKRLFGKEVRELIHLKMEELGAEILQSEVLEIIDPYIESEIDVAMLRNRYKKQIARSLIAKYRDEIGARKYFAIKDGNISKYVNIERTESIEDIKTINLALKKKIDGLIVSRVKANKRQQHLEGQVSVDELLAR